MIYRADDIYRQVPLDRIATSRWARSLVAGPKRRRQRERPRMKR
jgi:hypothetical protein